ncbi:serine protease [Herbaspirillum rubrisubalbicans]|uniref:Serine protease n=2 Tax=Herbaspirillum rubrisubalbicans TaxID=80842 RepID=A0AAD0U574_9BURK|nr:serine protease [Herbaspirillum rubrisubalbicans]
MMNKKTKPFGQRRVALPLRLSLLLCVFMLPFQVQANEAVMPAVEAKIPLQLSADATARPAYLARSQRRFDATSPIIGELQGGLFCSRKNDIVWNQKSSELLLPTNAMFARFRRELQQYGYPVPMPVAQPLFQEKTDANAPGTGDKPRPQDFNLQVGVIVSQVQTNLCLKGTNTWTGEAYVRLEWQVFAPEQRKVIYRTTTEGVYRARDKNFEGAVPPMPVEAFAVAVHNLLADPQFALAVQAPYDSVAAAANANLPQGTTDPAVPGSPVLIDNQPAEHPGSDIAKVMPELRSAVVTVLTERGSGTGFYIGSSGWLLTNYHVIGGAQSVRVRLPTGRELVAQVARADAARDIALLKTETPGVRPMPLRNGEPGVGEDVYALGSPLGDAFNTTLTRGILSGVRMVRDLEFLQSDVAILPGSSGGPLLDKSGQVVGITVAGLGAKGLAGMNFFIPVGSAIERLHLQLQNQNQGQTQSQVSKKP